ncbi:MAG TPA: quinone-dependent dihydroorotate dehydrogenase [Williamwhitmania sp.]|nr:quinone-dependent dihydroorotate dehydrogenase [Williamwhitmania sp.]
MYKRLIRPFLFCLNPESVHLLVATSLRIFFVIPGLRLLVKKILRVNDSRLTRTVFGLKFPSPVGLAAGFDKDAKLISEMDALGFGFIEVGTVTPKGQPGNPKPRSFRLPEDQALVNRMGFNNLGLEAAVAKLAKRRKKVIVGGNIGKNTLTPNSRAVEDYAEVFQGLYPYVDYFVVNVSCPNISDLHELQENDELSSILSQLTKLRSQQVQYRPILLKVSPDLSMDQATEQVKAAMQFGLDGVVATNTTRSREGLVTPDVKVNSLGSGGLSGKPLFEKSIKLVEHISSITGGKFPIVGVGGIMSEKDALDMLKAGASLIQVYTGFIYNGPCFIRRINRAIIKADIG